MRVELEAQRCRKGCGTLQEFLVGIAAGMKHFDMCLALALSAIIQLSGQMDRTLHLCIPLHHAPPRASPRGDIDLAVHQRPARCKNQIIGDLDLADRQIIGSSGFLNTLDSFRGQVSGFLRLFLPQFLT
jgi:hypothetical protein